jgi:glycine betaine catabolism A
MVHLTLPQEYYVSESQFRLELQRFFAARWVCVGRSEQAAKAGEYFVVELAGESILLVRDAAGKLHGHYNVCRHRGTRMCTEPSGTLPNARIRCPYHAWTYAIDGALLVAPHMDGEFQCADYPLHKVSVEEWEGHVFVSLEAPPTSVAQQLAPLTKAFASWGLGALQRRARITYDVRANWKLIVANYNECLHCPPMHPALNRLTDYMGVDNIVPTEYWIGGVMGFKPGVETMSMDGVRRRAFLPALDATQRAQVVYYALYPNLLLSLHPDYVMTHTLWPRAVDRTEIVCEFHGHPDEAGSFEDAVAFWDLTNREDWAISEQSQQGVSSRAYTPGPYSPREELLWGFDGFVRKGLGKDVESDQ